MKRKTILMLGAAVLAAAALGMTAFADENRGIAAKNDEEKIAVVRLAEIMNGDENGNMNFENPVTRAEFVKMAIAASSMKSNVPATSVFTLFPDVTYSHWACGYISTAIRGGLISGYLDGTFRPENTVTYEEAVTIVLRLLGYPNSDFLGAYPEPQMEKCRDIGLDTNISATVGQPMTRFECMKLIYNLLCTKTKNGQVYCTTLGYAADADGVIDYWTLLGAKKSLYYLNTNGLAAEKVPYLYDADTKIFRDGWNASAADIEEYDTFCYCDKLKTVWCYDNKLFGKVSAILPEAVTPQSVTLQTVSAAAGSITPGVKSCALDASAVADFAAGGIVKDDFIMACLDGEGNIVRAFPLTADLYKTYSDENEILNEVIYLTLSDAVVVTTPSEMLASLPYDFSKSDVLINEKNASLGEIRAHDVVYYSVPFDTLVVYENIVLGKLEAMKPSKQFASTVTVDGRTYSLEGDYIKAVIANDPTLTADTYVLLFLGKDGKAADIVRATSELYDLYADDDGDPIAAVTGSLSDPILVKDPAADFAALPVDHAKVSVRYEGEELTPSDIKKGDVLYYSTYADMVLVTRDKQSGILMSVQPSKENPASVMVGNANYQLATDEAKFAVSSLGNIPNEVLVTLYLGRDKTVVGIEKADMSVIGDGEDQVSYTDVVNATLKGPFIAPAAGKLLDDTKITAASATVYRDGKTSTLSAIRMYDVYYYSKLLNTVWVYDDTATGRIDSISPSSASPSSVTVSGKTYQLESASAKQALSSLGTFKVGDRVTLLLGKDGAAAGVIKAGAAENTSVYGIVISTGSGRFTDANGKQYSADTVTVYSMGGDTYTYEYDGKYTLGDAVRVDIGAENTSITKLAAPKSTAAIAALNAALEDGVFAPGAAILDVSADGEYGTIPTERMKGCKLVYTDVKYYALDANGAVETLILDNYTGDLSTYGYIVSVEKNEDKTYTLTYIIDDEEQKLALTSNIYSSRAGGASFVNGAGGISMIRMVTGTLKVSRITANEVYDANGKAFPLADDVAVYVRKDTSFKTAEVEDLIGKNYTITAYYDKDVADGGRVRVITAW